MKRHIRWDWKYEAWFAKGGLWWVWKNGLWVAQSLGERMWELMVRSLVYVDPIDMERK